MPFIITTIADWDDGPVGPGWFMILPKYRVQKGLIGPSADLPFVEVDYGQDSLDHKKRDDELVALTLLMNAQH